MLANDIKSKQRQLGRKLRVAVVVPTHWGFLMGGSQYQAQFLIEALYGTGVAEIVYFAARTSPTVNTVDHKVVNIGVKTPLRKYGQFWDYFRLQRRLKDFAPDVIYQRVRCAHTGISARYAKRHDIPFIWHVASDRNCVKRSVFPSVFRYPHKVLEAALSEYGMRAANTVIAQTAVQAELLRENYGIVVDRVVPNFHPEPLQKAQKGAPLIIVWVANLKAVKRPELIIETARLLQDLEDIRFKIVGAPYDKVAQQAEFESSVEELPNVEYLGKREQQAVNALLCKAHLLVNTSLAEGFSNTFIQAWMREVPVLTIGVNPDNMLNDSKFGKCCESVQELVDSIRQLVMEPERLSEMGAQSYVKSIEMFSMRNADQLAEMILKAGTDSAMRKIKD